jgi:hypothetical protein
MELAVISPRPPSSESKSTITSAKSRVHGTFLVPHGKLARARVRHLNPPQPEELSRCIRLNRSYEALEEFYSEKTRGGNNFDLWYTSNVPTTCLVSSISYLTSL